MSKKPKKNQEIIVHAQTYEGNGRSGEHLNASLDRGVNPHDLCEVKIAFHATFTPGHPAIEKFITAWNNLSTAIEAQAQSTPEASPVVTEPTPGASLDDLAALQDARESSVECDIGGRPLPPIEAFRSPRRHNVMTPQERAKREDLAGERVRILAERAEEEKRAQNAPKRLALEIVCEVFGWKSATISMQDAMAHFKTLDVKEQDKVTNALMRAIDAKALDLPNLQIAREFFTARVAGTFGN